jgi:hypothetical protein
MMNENPLSPKVEFKHQVALEALQERVTKLEGELKALKARMGKNKNNEAQQSTMTNS